MLSVQSPKVGGQQNVVVNSIGMTEEAVVEELASVTENHELIDASIGDYEGF